MVWLGTSGPRRAAGENKGSARLESARDASMKPARRRGATAGDLITIWGAKIVRTGQRTTAAARRHGAGGMASGKRGGAEQSRWRRDEEHGGDGIAKARSAVARPPRRQAPVATRAVAGRSCRQEGGAAGGGGLYHRGMIHRARWSGRRACAEPKNDRLNCSSRISRWQTSSIVIVSQRGVRVRERARRRTARTIPPRSTRPGRREILSARRRHHHRRHAAERQPAHTDRRSELACWKS